MGHALNEARAALAAHEIPVGCVIVFQDKIIASARNSRYSSLSKIAHAELNAIRSADAFLYEHQGACEIFVTLEPCMMCFGAIVCSRFRRVVFGARDYLAGAAMLPNLRGHYSRFNPAAIGGVLADESLQLLKDYEAQNGPKAAWAERYFFPRSQEGIAKAAGMHEPDIDPLMSVGSRVAESS